MSNKETIHHLLAEVKRLESLLSGIQDTEIYPVSFFNQSFDLTREILKELYQLEADQVEAFKKQLEARQNLLRESLLQTSVEQLDEPSVLPVEEPEERVTPVVEAEESVPEEQPADEEPLEPVTEETEEVLPEPEVVENPVGKTEKTIEELLREYAPSPPGMPEKTINPVKEEEENLPEEPVKEEGPSRSFIPEKNPACLGDLIEKKNLADFTRAFSLNDRFYFLRELFDGDMNRMNEVIADLNEIESLEESMDYLNTKMRWNPEEAPVADFIRLLEKRFL
ncbi:MAG: hypothetical protein LUG98_03245 [Tannerellaceae bacterium]|nr:hypothetical protein [Tannerellaceae bacterium]